MAVIYVAGPIFTAAEQAWLSGVVNALERRANVEVIWPFRDIPRGRDRRPEAVIQLCVEGLERADVMLAILDGPQVDDGTAWEVGFFFAQKGSSQIVGVRTDARAAGETHGSAVNTIVAQSCSRIHSSVEDALGEPKLFDAKDHPQPAGGNT